MKKSPQRTQRPLRLRPEDRFMILCNLIEALWEKRMDEDYFNVDLENLPPATSSQARRIALFIERLF